MKMMTVMLMVMMDNDGWCTGTGTTKGIVAGTYTGSRTGIGIVTGTDIGSEKCTGNGTYHDAHQKIKIMSLRTVMMMAMIKNTNT